MIRQIKDAEEKEGRRLKRKFDNTPICIFYLRSTIDE